MRITLTTKGLILVLVPLVFQIVFIAMLVHFLMQAEQSARQEYRSKTLAGRVTFLTAVLLANGTGAGGYIFTGKDTFKRHYLSSKEKAQYELLYLPSLIGDDQQEQKDFKILEQNARDVINFMGENIALADSGKLEEAKKRILSPKVDQYWAQIKNHSWQILETEEARQQNMPETLPSTRARLKELIVGGVACSFTISLLLLLAYSKNITTRLKVMMDNASRIAKGQMLNPQLRGSDEIATLDKVFHNMAAALTEASRKERAIIDEMLVGLAVINDQATVELTNPRMASIFGFDRQEMLGKPLLSLIADAPPEDQWNWLCGKALGHIAEIEGIKSSGERFPIELTISQFDSQGGSTRFLVNLLDVSERRQVENIRRQFVAMVSHELRTPLTSIRGGLTLLSVGALGELPQKAREVVLLAERNSVRLVSLINDLLDIEKLEAGMLEMQFANCAVDDITKRAVESVANLAQDKNIEVVVKVHAGVREKTTAVFADRDRIVQVLVNLLSNAIKFSNKDATIEIDIDAFDDDLRFSVTDHGRGIPQEFRPRLFQRFQQATIADSKERGGSGLGLAICKAIVERHGGAIGVRSVEGQGSTFWFNLPLHESARHPVNSSDCLVVD